ncbi:MAG: hypothetical protein E7617_02735 [Ruminococcaceae bacterium]|nr:hypothetical protein [Oscillospiraceae bacterium]
MKHTLKCIVLILILSLTVSLTVGCLYIPNFDNTTDDTSQNPKDPFTPDNSTKPEGPTEPEEPKDPEEPTEPEEPKDPEEPTEPEEPKDPEEPTDPEEPKDPEVPTDPEEPKDPEEPTDPEEPKDPEEPTEPEEPKDPEEPTEPEEPKDPEEPTEPEEPKPTEIPHIDYSEVDNSKYNTELFYKNDYDIGLGDPTVFCREENGENWFYVTGTTNGKSFQLWKTKDFTTWNKLGNIYTQTEEFFGSTSFWAPQLFYDSEADWNYYLGADAGNGKGLYLLFFSAKREDGRFMLAVAFSKTIDGTYKHFTGVNANGDYIDASNTCFDIEKLKDLRLYENTAYGALYKYGRGFIDASPYIDPVSGDKYLYMVRNRSVDTSNDVWGVKMKDWVSPDYSTTTPLTSYGYTTVNKTEKHNFTTKNKIDEGPFLYYRDNTDDGKDNGKYYLTFSIGDTNDKLYPVCQAIGDSPLGPFTKIQPEDGGFIICPGELWDIHGSGHHCFFEAGGELFIGHHTYLITNGADFGSRYFSFSKVEWVESDNGYDLMRANGPVKTIQPLPESASDYRNVTSEALASSTGASNHSLLSDGLIALRDADASLECIFVNGSTYTLEFSKPTFVRAILIYNSYDIARAFDSVKRIEMEYCKVIDGKLYRGIAYINDLGFNFDEHLVPEDYLNAKGYSGDYVMRPMGAAIAEFDEIAVQKITVYFSTHYENEVIGISEIVVLGKDADINTELYPYGGALNEEFPQYDAFIPIPIKDKDAVYIDGKLTDEIWQTPDATFEIAGATIDQNTKETIDTTVWGERNAKVYTYIDDNYVYFAFDVTDPNLFLNKSQPQGRSTCVEIYFAPKGTTVFENGCYSIRINPTGGRYDLSYRLGTYVPNEKLNEWQSVDLSDKVKVCVYVDGKIVTSADQTPDPKNNVGYVVEIAVSRDIIATDTDSFKFTAAFVQDKGYEEQRLNNSFIDGTHYLKPSSWIDVESAKNN